MQFSLPLLFIGFLTGLLIVSVFEPVRTARRTESRYGYEAGTSRQRMLSYASS